MRIEAGPVHHRPARSVDTPMRLIVALVALGFATVATANPVIGQAASCVAALKVRAEPLAQRLRAGDASAEAPLLPIVTASFAFIGTAYKQGLRKKEADEMLQAAERAQATMPPADLAKLQDACQAQGQQLYAKANYFERQFVSRAVSNRIDKLRRPA